MLLLSEVLIINHEFNEFEELVTAITDLAKSSNERFFRMDVKPPFNDTPDNWEDRLEAAFY